MSTKSRLKFDLLTEHRIRAALKTELLGKKIFAFWSVGSTNEFAYRRAMLGESEGTLVIAEEQTKGRGRQSRAWYSPFNKGLWFSLVLKPDLVSSKTGLVPYLAGLAVAEAIEKNTDLKPNMKWPNDLLLNQKKFCGILSEVEFNNGKINFIILGIGINVNHKSEEFPENFRDRATSLQVESGKRISRVDLLAEVLSRIEENYKYIRQNQFDYIIQNWKDRCPQFGKPIAINQDDTKYEGDFEEIDRDGALLLRLKSGELKKIVAGDIIF